MLQPNLGRFSLAAPCLVPPGSSTTEFRREFWRDARWLSLVSIIYINYRIGTVTERFGRRFGQRASRRVARCVARHDASASAEHVVEFGVEFVFEFLGVGVGVVPGGRRRRWRRGGDGVDRLADGRLGDCGVVDADVDSVRRRRRRPDRAAAAPAAAPPQATRRSRPAVAHLRLYFLAQNPSHTHQQTLKPSLNLSNPLESCQSR